MSDLQCKFCEKRFVSEVWYSKHSCKNKQIAEEYGNLNIVKAYELFRFWFQYNGFSKRSPKTMQQFITSPYFNDFMKMQDAISGVYMFNRHDFVIWLSENSIPINKWDKNSTIENYKNQHNKRGKSLDQFSKTVENMVLWCDIHNISYSEFFGAIPLKEAILWIQKGKLSPWYLLLTKRSQQLFDRLTDTEVMDILKFIDVEYWDARFKISANEVQEIEELIHELDI